MGRRVIITSSSHGFEPKDCEPGQIAVRSPVRVALTTRGRCMASILWSLIGELCKGMPRGRDSSPTPAPPTRILAAGKDIIRD
jgi:hypothetical protein